MSWRTTTRGTASARVTVDASELPLGQNRQSNRGSLLYQDAVVSERGNADDHPSNAEGSSVRQRRRTRNGHRLSIEDQLKVRRTSALLTNPQIHALMRSQREKTHLEQLKDKLLTHSPAKPSSTPSSNAHTLAHDQLDSVERLRKWLRVHIKTRPFRAMLYSVVLLDVFALAMDERLADEVTPFTGLDIVCTVLLFLEIALKGFAFGWVAGPSAYFTRSKRPVRLLNVSMLVLSLLSYVIGYNWRILRGLKTVRCLTLYAGLRRIMRSLARAIPFLANVSTLALFFLFAFSIFGLEAYKGAFSRQCRYDDPEVANDESFWTALPATYCSVNSSCQAPLYCGAVPPSSAHVNFDSGLSSLFLVFLVVAQDGWVGDIMRPVVEATSRFSSLYFVAIVASMVFLVVNLFVAVITTSFMNFSADSARAQENVKDSEEDESETVEPTRGSMIKMDPIEEATRVSLIMGATLAIEESIQQQRQQLEPTQREVDGGSELKPTAFARLLVRTHNFHSLRDHTVKATIDLLQSDGLGLAPSATVGSSALAPVINASIDNEKRDGARIDSVKPGPTTGEGDHHEPSTELPGHRASAIHSSSSPQRPTKLLVDHAPFSSLTDVLEKARRSDGHSPAWFRAFQRFVLSKRFDDFITGCIVVNTAFLLVEFRHMPSWVSTMLSVVEYLFGAIFFAEMIARIIAMRGLRRYLHSTERFFDMVVVVCTSVNMFSGLNSVSSLRTLRVSRLMLKWEGTRKLIESVVKSSRGVMDVVAFLILFQVVSSIMAMQLFGGSHMIKDGQSPRWNFDSFPRSFLTLLQVITADQWASITYDAVNADDPHPFLVPFLIMNFIIGQYVLLNLFIAVILENFAISEEEAYQLQLEQIIAIPKELDIYEKIEEEGVRAFGEMEQLDNVSNVKLRMFLGLDAEAAANGDGSSTGDHDHHRPSTVPTRFDRALALGRRACLRVVRSSGFHRVVQLMILVSCVTLMLDDPHPEILVEPPSEDRVLALTICNRVALGVFLLEFIVKVGACGFGIEYVKLQLFHRDEALGYVKKQAYIEDRWNQLDCFLLTLTVADEIISHASNSTSLARMFRAGRVLRPLRILNHHHEMKLILSAVAQSLPHVGNVFGLCAIVYIIFGVVGRSLFSGQFFSCNDGAIATMDECVGFFLVAPDGVTDPSGAILMPRVWSNARFSFDNIGAAFLTLLEMTSLKWIDKTFMAMDITAPTKQPEQDNAPYNAIFFILYIYIGSLFVIRLFVGVLVEQFQRNNGTQILTESQKSWVDLEKFVLVLKPLKRIPRPPTQLQDKLYDLCQHRYFGRTIAVAILLNVALLLFSPSKNAASESEVDISAQSTSFEAIEMLFLAVFLTEAVLKCLAFRHYYILSSTGAFELLILGGSLAAYSLSTGIHGLIQVGRVFRMMRVLRFVRLNRGVYAVFQTFRASLKPIGHIFFLLFMIFFIFAVVGRQLFGGVRLGENMNGSSNFRSFSSSFLLLFQIMAGDDWHLTMTDCMQTKPFCVERVNSDTGKTESDCGSPVAAVLFFVTYITLVVFFLLNLFIAVVLENFRSCYLQDDVCPISLQDFETYKEVFMKYDTEGRGTIPLWQLGNFLNDLPPGLRVDRRQHRAAFLQLRSQAQVLLDNWLQHRCRRPFFNELLRALCIHQLGIRCLPYEQQRDRVKQIFIYRAKVADMLVDATMKGYVQRWRLRKERERMHRLREKMVPEKAMLGAGGQAREPSSVEIDTSLRPDKLRRAAVASFVEETIATVVSQTATDTAIVTSLPSNEEPVATVAVDAPADPIGEAVLTSLVVESEDVPAPESPEPSSPERRRHKHHHKHKHKKKHRHKDKHALVVPEDHGHGDDVGTVSSDPLADETLVPKFDQPLYAPRRLPKITHKVVPTG